MQMHNGVLILVLMAMLASPLACESAPDIFSSREECDLKRVPYYPRGVQEKTTGERVTVGSEWPQSGDGVCALLKDIPKSNGHDYSDGWVFLPRHFEIVKDVHRYFLWLDSTEISSIFIAHPMGKASHNEPTILIETKPEVLRFSTPETPPTRTCVTLYHRCAAPFGATLSSFCSCPLRRDGTLTFVGGWPPTSPEMTSVPTSGVCQPFEGITCTIFLPAAIPPGSSCTCLPENEPGTVR